MTVRVLWGLCLAIGAMICGVGVELHFAGAGPLQSFPLVAGGILFLPLAAAGVERLAGSTAAD
jgi:hypothetical protein